MFAPMAGRLALTFVLAMLVPMPAATALRGRTVRGKVCDSSGAVVKGAAVQLKNTSTLSIRSYLTRNDGSYRFVGLSLNLDYDLRASFGGHWSSTGTVSRFDSREAVEVDLTIPTLGARPVSNPSLH